MKNALLSIGMIFAFLFGATATAQAQNEIEPDTNILFEGKYDIAPSFPGGNEALWECIQLSSSIPMVAFWSPRHSTIPDGVAPSKQ